MKLKSILQPLIFITALLGLSAFLEAFAQSPKVVRITGSRFTYALVENWIDQYVKVNPDVQVIIEARGTNDPLQYDVLIESYEQSADAKKDRDYHYIGRYAILPVANSNSAFAKNYVTKGLTTQAIKQIYFNDIFSEDKITTPYTTYTRLQKAGPPIVFATYFKYEQKDIIGKGIAGSDEHLIKAVLRDTTAVTYLPTPMIYAKSGLPVTGITPIPVDLNDNGRISDDEKFFGNRATTIDRLATSKDIHNVPIEYIHLSVDKKSAKPEAVAFIKWVIENGLSNIKDFGFLSTEPSRIKTF